MPKRVCAHPGCPTLINAGTRDNRCPTHQRTLDQARGTTADRGYGGPHRRLSERQRAAAIGTTCHLCKQPMHADQELALDHTEDRTGYRGVVHLSCNARDGAQRGNANRPRG